MSLDAYAKTLQQAMHHKLDYSLANTADYVLERRSVKFFPLAGDKFSPNSTRTASFRLTGTSYVDPSTVRLCGNFKNKTARAMDPTSAAHGMWSEARVICAGSPIETVQSAGKVAETIFRMMTPNAKVRYCDQSFPLVLSGSGACDPERGKLSYSPIAASATVPWQMELLPLGLFHSQNKLLPLRFMPLILEFTLGGMNQMFNTGGMY